jgi:hypothetical protein
MVECTLICSPSKAILRDHYGELGKGDLPPGSEEDQKFREGIVKEMEGWQEVDSEGNLDVNISVEEVESEMAKLANGKAAPGLVNELFKKGGPSLSASLAFLFNLALKLQRVPTSWGEGVVVSLFKKGDATDPGNYRGITLLDAVRKLFCRVISTRLTKYLEESGGLHEGQAGFRPGRSCEDHIFTLSQVVQGRKRGDRKTFAFFLDVKKAYDSVWRDGLWYKLREKGVRGRVLQTLRALYASSSSRVAVNGGLSDPVAIEKGVAQGCTLSCFLFDVFVDDLLREVEAAGFGVPFGEASDSTAVREKLAALMFADDFVGLECSAERLQALILVVERWCKRWGLEANVLKCAIMVFHGEPEDKEFGWTWGEAKIPVVPSYTYLGVVFSEDCLWEAHASAVVSKGLRGVEAYSRLLRAQNLTVAAKHSIIVTAIRPVLEYASGVWLPSSKVGQKLEAVQLKAAKTILRCAVTTPSIAVRGDLGLQPLLVRRAVAVAKWRLRLESMGVDRYPRKVFSADWPKLRRGGEAKSWKRGAADILASSGFSDQSLGEVDVGVLQAAVEESMVTVVANSEMGGRKIDAYRSLGDSIALQPYLKGCLSLGARLKFKFRAGSHGLGEELGRRRGVAREDRSCELCGGDVESAAHFMLVCPAVGDLRANFLSSLRSTIGDDRFRDFTALSLDLQALRLLASSPWGSLAGEVDCLVQDYISRAWKLRSIVLHGEKSFYYQEGHPASSPLSLSSDSVKCRRVIYGLESSDVSVT